VSRWLDTRFLPIEFTEDPHAKHARIPGLMEASITEIKGRDRSQPVTFENIFNQIHAPTQVLAYPARVAAVGVIRIATRSRRIGLLSKFEVIGSTRPELLGC
jgi:hypothetical protein